MKIYAIILSLIFSGILFAQNLTTGMLYRDYFNYKCFGINKKEIKPELIYSLIENIKKADTSLHIVIKGRSLEERPIYLVKYGFGKIHVLLWSQMHGDESTATEALIDIFNFLKANDSYNKFRQLLKKKLTIFFIPMLNPDGAFRFKRRNALQIDLNRDAARLQFPESRLLETIRDSVKPLFGFNLHDQQKYYAAGRTFYPATISFLAPAFNFNKDTNSVRRRTMKLIANISRGLEEIIPGHIGRYNDDFEPRAFGDNFVKKGTASVLIESGGWPGDDNKQFVRELNFIAILYALQSIATGEFNSFPVKAYFRIPENKRILFDIIFRNLKINFNNKSYLVDVAINREELPTENFESVNFVSKVEDIGDLSTFYGYEEYDCAGMELRPAKILNKNFEFNDLNTLPLDSLYSMGYSFVSVNNMPDSIKYFKGINLVTGKFKAGNLKLNKPANFIIVKNNRIVFNVINGFVFNNISKKGRIQNGIIFKK